ncbi:MAG TPA: hypothetical protein VF551_09375 [Chthoniobacterales bacterium]|jgi:Spy/CpxP family protein refolding chaperone
MKRTLIALAACATLAVGSLAVYAQGGGDGGPRGKGHGHRMGGGNPLEHLTKKLDLTAQQQAQVAPIVDQAKPQIRAIHEEAMQKTRAILENSAAQIRPLLTPEQQQKFDAMKKAHEDMMNARRAMHEAEQG